MLTDTKIQRRSAEIDKIYEKSDVSCVFLLVLCHWPKSLLYRSTAVGNSCAEDKTCSAHGEQVKVCNFHARMRTLCCMLCCGFVLSVKRRGVEFW
jgi:hypothetical protein